MKYGRVYRTSVVRKEERGQEGTEKGGDCIASYLATITYV